MSHPSFDSVLCWLLAEGATTETVDPNDVSDPVYDEEEFFLSRAQPRRKREFRAGRTCARKALARLGVFDFPLLAGRGGEPIWPVGVVGSISHCRDYCIAVAARARHVSGIGVDVENVGEVPECIDEQICTRDEATWIKALPVGERQRGLAVLFSAKECVYKCQYTTSRRQLDFQDVRVLVDPGWKTFTATVREPVRGSGSKCSHGHLAVSEDHVLTAVVLRNAAVATGE